MIYKASDIKEVKHNNRMHSIIFTDGSTATYYNSTVNYNHSFAVAYYQTRTGKNYYKSIVSFAADGSIDTVSNYYRPRKRS